MSRVDEVLGKEKFLFSPRAKFHLGRAVLDGASGLFDPEDLNSIKDYQEGFEMGLPSRE